VNGAVKASSFWAKGADTIKTASSPTPIISEPPTPKEAAAAKKGLVLKGSSAAKGQTSAANGGTGMANGSMPNLTPRKTTNWADSDDDDDFIAEFSAKKNPRVTTLETEVEQMKAEIEALNATVGTKDARIQELEDVVAEKELEIGSWEASMKEKDAQADKVTEESHTQYLYVQELVAEVDEKSRRIKELETELDVKAARISALEHKVTVDTIMATISFKEEPTSKVEHAAPAALITPVEPVEDAKTEAAPSETTKVAPQTPVEDVQEPPTATPENATPKKASAGPAIVESTFPQLWSPDKPKKIVPPVEKPRTLVMAIDTSKYGKKKPTPVVLQKKLASDNGKGFQASYGQSTKQRTKTDVVPDFAVDKDIRQMPHAVRVLYANGPDATVFMGEKKLATLPKYVLMQCSGKASKYFHEHPEATQIVFPANCMDADSAIAHLNWMVEMTYQGRVYSITLNGEEKHNLKNLKICQAARVMGLNNTYVGHFTKVLCDRVRSNTSSLEFLSAICALAYPENDPIFECLANNLVNQQGSTAFKRAEDLEALLVKFPLLKEKMDKIQVRVRNSRLADKRKGTGGGSRDGSKGRGGATHRDGRKEDWPAITREG
jgi:TolA-binding protein